MATRVQLRRGTTSEHSTFTGAEGEVTVDTTKNTTVVHDGATQGGFPVATEASLASKLSPGDNVSELVNDAGYVTSAEAGGVTSVNGKSGIVVLNADDIDDSTTTHKFASESELLSVASAIQPGDNISKLNNDAGYVTSAEAGGVTSVNGKSGIVVLNADDIDDSTTTHKFASEAELLSVASAIQPGDNISKLNNDAGYVTSAEAGGVTSVNGKSGIVVLNADDIDDSTTTHKFASESELLSVASAIQPGDNISKLNNDAGYITSAEAGGVTSVNGKSGIVVLNADDIDDSTTTHKFASEAELLSVASAIQPGDNISKLNNDSGFIISSDVPVQSVAGKTGNVTLDKSDVGLGNVDNTSDLNKPISTSTQSALNAKADLVGGLVPTSQLPAVALSDFRGSVASEAEMIALSTATIGDWCYRTDIPAGYLLKADPYSTASNWLRITGATGQVVSVNGQVGTVVLSADDVGALKSGDDVSELTNDAGYITSSAIPTTPTLQEVTNQGSTTTTGATFDGDVGIGTDSPSYKLDVRGGDILIGQSSGATTGIRNYLNFGRASGAKAGIGFINTFGYGKGSLIFMNNNDDTLSGFTDSDEVMRITPGGSVGIGTTNPKAKLDVAASGNGEEVLRLSTERPWGFFQVGTSTETSLDLRSNSNKKFTISGVKNGAAAVSTSFMVDTGSGNAECSGKITSASTTITDSGTTLVTKDYLDQSTNISVKDFGATGDGTTDDTSSIQAAFNHIAVSGETLLFPIGTYYITSPLTLYCDAEHHQIICDDSAVIKVGGQAVFAATPAITITVRAAGASVDHTFSWEGGTIDGTGMPNRGGGAPDLMTFGNALIDSIVIRRVQFLNNLPGRPSNPSSLPVLSQRGDSGLMLGKANNARVEDCTFIGQPDAGIYVSGHPEPGNPDSLGCRNLVVSGCHFKLCGFTVGAAFISKRRFRNCIIVNNTFEDCRVGVSTGEVGDSVTINQAGYRMLVANNTFLNTLADAIDIRASDNSVVSNNVIENIGFRINWDGTQASVPVPSRATGVAIRGSSYCNVANNVIFVDNSKYNVEGIETAQGIHGIYLAGYTQVLTQGNLTTESNFTQVSDNNISYIPRGITEDQDTSAIRTLNNIFSNNQVEHAAVQRIATRHAGACVIDTNPGDGIVDIGFGSTPLLSLARTTGQRAGYASLVGPVSVSDSLSVSGSITTGGTFVGDLQGNAQTSSKVAQSGSGQALNRPILVKNSAGTANENEPVRFSNVANTPTVNTSTGEIKAPGGITANLTGNASRASSAIRLTPRADGSTTVNVQGMYAGWNLGNGTASGASIFINQKGLGTGSFEFVESTTNNVFSRLVRIHSTGKVQILGSDPTFVGNLEGNADTATAASSTSKVAQSGTSASSDKPILVKNSGGTTNETAAVRFSSVANTPTVNTSNGKIKAPGGITADLTGNSSTASKVKVNASTGNADYPLLFHNLAVGTTDNSNIYYSNSTSANGKQITMNPRSGTIVATNFQGNAASANKLNAPRTLWGVSFDGTANISGAMTGVNSITGANANLTIEPASSGSNRNVYLRGNANTGGGGGLVVVGHETRGDLYFRTGGKFRFCKAGQTAVEGFLNFNSLTTDRTYTFPNATGTIALTSSSITGNAATATKLATARTLWGVSFNGTANISGSMTGVNNITGVNAAMIIQPADSTTARTLYLRGNNDTNGTGGAVVIGHESRGNLSFRTGLASTGYRFYDPGRTDRYGALKFDNITASRTYTFPNASGTVALTSTSVQTSGNQDISGTKTFTAILKCTSSGGDVPARTADGIHCNYAGATARVFITRLDNNTNPALRISRGGSQSAARLIDFTNEGGTTVGSITTNGTRTTYVETSDYRVKKDVTPLANASTRVAKLKPVSFVYTDRGNGESYEGFIAHELAEACPDAVVGEKDGEEYQGVATGRLIPLLAKALQEVLQKNDELEARIAVLEGN